MTLRINKQAYTKLIEQDLEFLRRHILDESPERDHIGVVLGSSIDLLYPDKKKSSGEDWHDLEANPKDLPGHREIVLVSLKFDMIHYAIGTYSQVDSSWYLREDEEFYQTNKEVIKWKSINE